MSCVYVRLLTREGDRVADLGDAGRFGDAEGIVHARELGPGRLRRIADLRHRWLVRKVWDSRLRHRRWLRIW
jgi:hypothetical protein